MSDFDPAYRIREATQADIQLLATHRAAMFRDMGSLDPRSEAPLIEATANYFRHALPRGEYLGWVAETVSSSPEPIGGAGFQIRPILPRPRPSGDGLEPGPEALILNVYVVPPWRRRGVAEALMRALLAALDERRIRRILLHASNEGRPLYERLGFVGTTEMQLT